MSGREDPLWCFLIEAVDEALDANENPYHEDGGGPYYLGGVAEYLADALRRAGWVEV